MNWSRGFFRKQAMVTMCLPCRQEKDEWQTWICCWKKPQPMRKRVTKVCFILCVTLMNCKNMMWISERQIPLEKMRTLSVSWVFIRVKVWNFRSYLSVAWVKILISRTPEVKWCFTRNLALVWITWTVKGESNHRPLQKKRLQSRSIWKISVRSCEYSMLP